MPSTIFERPASRSAVVAQDDGTFAVTDNASFPELDSNSILVKTEAFAINPSDTKMLGDFHTPGAILGTDYAGIVVALGSEVKDDIAVGDRICGAAHGMNRSNKEKGAFATYVQAENDIYLKLPSSMSIEAGASLCAGLCTMALALRALSLPTPEQPASFPQKVLVYGGSTASGTLVMQLLRLSNLIPVTTCSPKNFDLVKSYGAEVAFDYRSQTCAADIRDYTKNNLAFAIDCITTVASTTCCYGAIGRAGGKYVALDPYPEHAATRKAINASWVLGPSIFGQDIGWPAPYKRAGDSELRKFGRETFKMIQRLLDDGKLRNHALRVLETSGLEGVLEGMELLRSGVISGEKVIVKVT